jgi:hypothetical protein
MAWNTSYYYNFLQETKTYLVVHKPQTFQSGTWVTALEAPNPTYQTSFVDNALWTQAQKCKLELAHWPSAYQQRPEDYGGAKQFLHQNRSMELWLTSIHLLRTRSFPAKLCWITHQSKNRDGCRLEVWGRLQFPMSAGNHCKDIYEIAEKTLQWHLNVTIMSAPAKSKQTSQERVWS